MTLPYISEAENQIESIRYIKFITFKNQFDSMPEDVCEPKLILF